ncbi:hypothetical protein DFJ77DRAFT_542443 [Powellomyces hirtus]|nr:hypothetical protein DFJ77DRAFT_542443 [Powellomyces hirtus]
MGALCAATVPTKRGRDTRGSIFMLRIRGSLGSVGWMRPDERLEMLRPSRIPIYGVSVTGAELAAISPAQGTKKKEIDNPFKRIMHKTHLLRGSPVREEIGTTLPCSRLEKSNAWFWMSFLLEARDGAGGRSGYVVVECLLDRVSIVRPVVGLLGRQPLEATGLTARAAHSRNVSPVKQGRFKVMREQCDLSHRHFRFPSPFRPYRKHPRISHTKPVFALHKAGRRTHKTAVGPLASSLDIAAGNAQSTAPHAQPHGERWQISQPSSHPPPLHMRSWEESGKKKPLQSMEFER